MTTRIPMTDAQAQACFQITARGWVLAPVWLPPNCVVEETADVRDGRVVSTRWAGEITGGPPVWSPFPEEGHTFYVGEVTLGDWSSPSFRVLYRAAGDVKPTGTLAPYRWLAASRMGPDRARTAFRVHTRLALPIAEISESMAAGMGLRTAGAFRVMGAHGDAMSPLDALREWWPRWFRRPFDTASWVFAAEVERLPTHPPAL